MAGKLTPCEPTLFSSLPSQEGTNPEHHASSIAWKRSRDLTSTNIQEQGQGCRSFKPPYCQLHGHPSDKLLRGLQNLRRNPSRHGLRMVQVLLEMVFKIKRENDIFSAASSESAVPCAATAPAGSSSPPHRLFAHPVPEFVEGWGDRLWLCLQPLLGKEPRDGVSSHRL